MKKVTQDLLSDYPLPDHAGGDKRGRGRVLVVAGSMQIPGAALLASLSALRAGAGVLQVATCEAVAPQLGIAMPEAMVFGYPATSQGGIHPSACAKLAELAAECDAVLIGPGMTDQEATAELAVGLLRSVNGPNFAFDASAFIGLRAHLNMVRAHNDRVVVTPHSGEMAKFLGMPREEVEREPLAAAQEACRLSGSVVVLKGVSTYIVSPSRESWFCEHGCVGLATSGSGDTLGGIVAGLLARGTGPAPAAIWSVYIHAEAGQRLTRKTGSVGFLAREIPGEIPRILEDFGSIRPRQAGE